MKLKAHLLRVGVALAVVGVSVAPGSPASATIASTTYGRSCVAGTSSSMPFANSTNMSLVMWCAFNPDPAATAAWTTFFNGLATSTDSTTPVTGYNCLVTDNCAAAVNTYYSASSTGTNTFTGQASRCRTYAYDRGRLIIGSTVIAAATQSSYPDNYVRFVSSCNNWFTSGLQLVRIMNVWWQSGSLSLMNTMPVARSFVQNGKLPCDTAHSSNSTYSCIEQPTWAQIDTAVPELFDGQAFVTTPSCQTMGMTFETRASGSTTWSALTMATELDYFQPIRYTMVIPADGTVTHLSLQFRSGSTPIETVAIAPYGQPFQLGAFFSFDPTAPNYVEKIGILGKAVHWLVRAETVGPTTVTGQISFPGNTGSTLTTTGFKWACESPGGNGVFDVTGVGSGGTTLEDAVACDALRVVTGAHTESEWVFRVRKPVTVTALVRVMYRYDGGAWQTWYEVLPAPTTAAIDQPMTISKSGAPSLAAIEFRCTANTPGGPDTDRTIGPTGPRDGGDGLTLGDCFGPNYLGTMSLTSPSSWLSGLGRMGTCIVQYLFVPSDPDEWLDDQVTTLTARAPISFVTDSLAIATEAVSPHSATVYCAGALDGPGTLSSASVCGQTITSLTVSTGNRSLIVGLIVALTIGLMGLSVIWMFWS